MAKFEYKLDEHVAAELKVKGVKSPFGSCCYLRS